MCWLRRPFVYSKPIAQRTLVIFVIEYLGYLYSTYCCENYNEYEGICNHQRLQLPR